MNVAQETLGLRRQGFSPCLSLLMSAFALLIPPADLSIRLLRLTERSPTAHALLPTRSTAMPLDFAVDYALLARMSLAKRGIVERAERNARTRSFGVQFEPRYIFRAGRLDQ